MIHLVTAYNRHLYKDELVEMHRLRREIFVEELGWPLQVREDGGEYDEYDDGRAMYLLGLNGDGHVEISMRVRPTDDGHCMIANHYPHLVAADEPPICAPGIWEATRIMSVPALRRSQAAPKRNFELQLATIEAAQKYGVSRLVGMVDVFWLTKLKNEVLWRTRVIGPPAPHGSGEIAAFEIDSTPDAVREGRERMGMETALIELDASADELPRTAKA